MFLDKDHKPRQAGDPPSGDMGWLWYRPGNGMRESIFPNFSSYCGRCDVFDVPDLANKRFKCWNCGRFLPRPRSWNDKYYKPYGPPNRAPSCPPPIQPTLDEALNG